MTISFQCDVCSKTLSANAVASGRVITCPYCHKTTKVPRLEENEELGTNIRPATVIESQIKSGRLASSDDSQWRDPTFDSDWKKMLEKFPNFQPNPFGISFPIDVAIQEASVNAEVDEETQDSDENDGSTSSQYSVDDLIKGVE